MEKEVYYHIDTRDLAKFYTIALHFSITFSGTKYVVHCRKLNGKQRDYLSKMIGINLYPMDNVILYLKGV